jgi:replicative DNA helicase
MKPTGSQPIQGRQTEQNLKLPPQNVEAEQAVLGAILLDNQALYRTLEILDPDEFYRPAHQRIFKAMVELSEQNQVIDLVTMTDHLRRTEILDSIGGTGYLTDLAQSVATAAGVVYHARLIHDTAISRSLIVAATEIVSRGYEGTRRVDELLDFAERSIFGIAERRLKRLFTSMQEVVTSTVAHIDLLYSRGERITGIPTGFKDLDERTAGLQPSDLIIIAGRPSMGKTSLALGIALNAALNKTRHHTVAIFSLEMSKEQLCMRLLSAQGSLNMHRIRTGHLNENEWKTLAQTASLLHDSPIYIDDTPAISVLELGAKVRRLRAEHTLDLVVVDYLQLMSGGGNSENRQQEISDISRSLKSLAKELNIPVVALSQLSRAVENRPSKKPLLADLRESGAIEQDADLVMMIYRSEMYASELEEGVDKADEEHVAEILIAKHRNGPTGFERLTFLPEYAKFGNYQNPDKI